MLLALVCLAALAPGLATAWVLRSRGRLIATLAGAGVTVSLPFLLLISLVVFPPLGVAVGVGAVFAAMDAYDRGRPAIATAWVGLAAVALACSGWSL